MTECVRNTAGEFSDLFANFPSNTAFDCPGPEYKCVPSLNPGSLPTSEISEIMGTMKTDMTGELSEDIAQLNKDREDYISNIAYYTLTKGS